MKDEKQQKAWKSLIELHKYGPIIALSLLWAIIFSIFLLHKITVKDYVERDFFLDKFFMSDSIIYFLISLYFFKKVKNLDGTEKEIMKSLEINPRDAFIEKKLVEIDIQRERLNKKIYTAIIIWFVLLEAGRILEAYYYSVQP